MITQSNSEALPLTPCSAFDVASEFRAELQELLDKWGAEMEATDHWQGYAECGEDIRITVDIPAIWTANHDCLREYVEIDFGSRLSSKNVQEHPTEEAK